MEKPLENKDLNKTNNEPIIRKDRIPRSPVRPRLHSVPNLKLLENPTIKRKRGDGPQNDTVDGNVLIDTIKLMFEHISSLHEIVSESYKPKQEIKEIAVKLMQNVDTLIDERVFDYLNDKRKNTDELTVGRATDAEPKCPECLKEQKRTEMRKRMRENDSFENFLSIPEDLWNDECFTHIQKEEGLIWETPDQYDVMLPCDKMFGGYDSFISRAINRFGKVEGLKRQEKSIGNTAIMVQSSGFPDQQGVFSYQTKAIYYPIIADKGQVAEARDEDIFNSLKEVKKYMDKANRQYLAIPEVCGVVGTMVLRIMEFLFTGTDKYLIILGKRKDQDATGLGGKKSQRNSNQNKNPKEKQGDTLLIRAEGDSYAELLKKVKRDINPEDLGIEVSNIKPSKKGELLVTLKQGGDKVKRLQTEILNKLPEASATVLLKKKVLHVKDLDQVTNEDDIKAAIMQISAVKESELEIRALRPAFGNRQNVTIIMPEKEAEEIIKTGRLKVGWSSCRVAERKKDDKCYRCWETGHDKMRCKGTDRTNMCMKCTAEGHKASQCKAKAYCLHCKAEGHQTGSRKCSNVNKQIK